MEIWLKFCKSKYIANVSMGKFLKMLPITVCQYMAKYSTYGILASTVETHPRMIFLKFNDYLKYTIDIVSGYCQH